MLWCRHAKTFGLWIFSQISANLLKHNSGKVTPTERELYGKKICRTNSFPESSWFYRHQRENNTNSYISQPESQQEVALYM